MTIDRRKFLTRALSTGALTTVAGGKLALGAAPATKPAAAPDLSTWAGVRAEFPLSRDYIHMALMLLTSHPRPVREAIDRHRRGLDDNPVVYGKQEGAVRAAAADYTGGKPDEIALTGNTTTGLALLYGGLPLRPRQEILTTTHDHYVTYESLRLRALHTGAAVRKVPLYAVPEKATTDAIADVNKKRADADRVLLCVDGVHGFGVEQDSFADLGCDFFVAGCHKWMFGPRGTGIVWGRPDAWKGHQGIIPTFDWAAFELWMKGKTPESLPPGPRVTPGGFQAFEHRWALAEAFRFHLALGKPRVTARIHELAKRCKQGLAAIGGKVKLRTPMSEELSSGITCFEIDGMPPQKIVDRLFEKKIVASDSPYATSYARLTPGLLNTPEEVDRAVAEVKAIAA
jgi:selenocysteine lyase/cysteine desulfurase